MPATIAVSELHKRYGTAVALDGMTFTAAPGIVTGFVGPNGAGKSTTMRVVLGLDRAQSGSALVGGRDYRTLDHPLTHLGSLIDAAALHPGRSGRNHLRWLACSQGLGRKRVDEVLAMTGMTPVARRKAGGYSLGMRQRLGIAAALLGSPGTLVLDEPVNGLDPDGVHWVRELVRSLAAGGTTVLLSSHLMSEMAQTADDVVVLGRGRLVASGAIDDVVAAATGNSVRVRLASGSPAEPLAAAVSAAGGTVADQGDALVVTGLTSEQIGHTAARTGSVLAELTPQSASLEDAFFELTKDAVEYTTGGTGR